MIHRTTEMHKTMPDGSTYEETKEEFMIVPDSLQKLIGDGNAQIERSKTIGQSLNYGAARISVTCSVRLTCNQTKASVKKASTEIANLLDSIMIDDIQEIDDFIRGARHETE